VRAVSDNNDFDRGLFLGTVRRERSFTYCRGCLLVLDKLILSHKQNEGSVMHIPFVQNAININLKIIYCLRLGYVFGKHIIMF